MANGTGNGGTTNWTIWRKLFERRKDRALPTLHPGIEYGHLPRSLASSLAVFQLGESGGGTIVEQVRRSKIAGIDEDYATAIELFVQEEHRHANILGMCVRLLRGELIRKNWTAKLFVFARRLIGLRLKVLVLLAAEVVGICYYASVADRVASGPMRRWLQELANDERAHLAFHSDFLRCQTSNAWQRQLFVIAWRVVAAAASCVFIVDHRHALRDMGIDLRVTWHRLMAVAHQAESFVIRGSEHSTVNTVLRDHQDEYDEDAREGRNAEQYPGTHQVPVVVASGAFGKQVTNANLYPDDRNPACAYKDIQAEDQPEPCRIVGYAELARQPETRDQLNDDRGGREQPVGSDYVLAGFDHGRLFVTEVRP